MTKLLDQALQVARRLSPDAQDDIARLVLQLAGANDEAEPVPLTADERAAIDASKRAAARGEFASEAEVEAVWAKYGL
jgi:predicted transcriptional regulator